MLKIFLTESTEKDTPKVISRIHIFAYLKETANFHLLKVLYFIIIFSAKGILVVKLKHVCI